MPESGTGSELYLASFRNHTAKDQKTFWGSRKKALVLVAGSGIGGEGGFCALSVLRQAGYELWVVPSKEAVNAYGLESIASLAGVPVAQLGGVRIDAEAVGHVDLLYLPVVSPGFVAKVAHGVYDDILTRYVFHALMAGVPVVGVEDGAEPASDCYKALGYTEPPPGLVQLLQSNIAAAAKVGIRLRPLETIADELTRTVGVSNPEAEEGMPVLDARVVTRSDLLGLENRSVLVSPTTRFTDLAKEYAAGKSIDFLRRQEGT